MTDALRSLHPRVVLALSALLALPATAADKANDNAPVLQISTAQGTVDCTGQHVEVLAEHAQLTFTGACLDLFFLGNDTRATVESARLVQVVSDDVSVAVAGSLSELRQLGHRGNHRVGKTGLLYVQGDETQIVAESLGTSEVIGSRNRIQWQAGQPKTNDIGNDNQLQALK